MRVDYASLGGAQSNREYYACQRRYRCAMSRQTGFSYVELLIAMGLITVALVPVMNSFFSLSVAAEGNAQVLQQQAALRDKVAELRAEPFADLLAAAAAAGGEDIASSYSDAPGSDPAVFVYLSYYDVLDTDTDGDPFTILDTNSDADNNPYTGPDVVIELLWVSVAVENTSLTLQSLVDL